MKKKRVNRAGIKVVSSSDKRSHECVTRIHFAHSLSCPRLRYFDDRVGGTCANDSVYISQDTQRTTKERILDIIIKKNMRFRKEEKAEIKSLYADMKFTKLLRFLESLENEDSCSKD